jgi:hypothetical protein
VDEFLGDNAGLVVAEIELQREDEPSRTDWAGADVTEQSRYYNRRAGLAAVFGRTPRRAAARLDPSPSSRRPMCGDENRHLLRRGLPLVLDRQASLPAGLQLLGADAPELDIHWQPFQLDPDADATPVPLREALCASSAAWPAPSRSSARPRPPARAEGLPMDFSQGRCG